MREWGKVLGEPGTVRGGLGSGPDSHKALTFLSGLREKSCVDHLADRYRTVLDGFRYPDNAVRTDAGGLRVGVGDALMCFISDVHQFMCTLNVSF